MTTMNTPTLPPEHHHDSDHVYFTADQMLAYAEAAILKEREACIQAVTTEMNKWLEDCSVSQFRLSIAVIKARKNLK